MNKPVDFKEKYFFLKKEMAPQEEIYCIQMGKEYAPFKSTFFKTQHLME